MTKELSNVSITLDEAVLDKLRQSVSFSTAADVQALVADAINCYVQLGRLHQEGATFLVSDSEGKSARLRFPFDAGHQA